MPPRQTFCELIALLTSFVSSNNLDWISADFVNGIHWRVCLTRLWLSVHIQLSNYSLPFLHSITVPPLLMWIFPWPPVLLLGSICQSLYQPCTCILIHFLEHLGQGWVANTEISLHWYLHLSVLVLVLLCKIQNHPIYLNTYTHYFTQEWHWFCHSICR